MDVRHKTTAALAFLVVLYTLYTILLQIGGSTIGLLPQLFYGFLIGFVVSSMVSFASDRGRGIVSISRQPKIVLAVVVAGLINNALTQLFLGYGTLGTNAAIAGIVYRSWVIMIALLIPLTLRQKVKRMQMLATLVGFSGLYLLISGGTLFSVNPVQLPFIGLVLLAALCTTISTLIMSKYTFNVFGAVVFFNLVSFVLLALLVTATHTSLGVAFTPKAIYAVLILGIFGFGIATSLYYYSVKALGAQIVGNAILAVPFLTIILSALIVNTPIKAYYLIAALLISAGMFFQRRYSALPERITSKSTLENVAVYDITSAFVDNKNPVIAKQMLGDKRALAIKLNEATFDQDKHNHIFQNRDCLAFTNRVPHSQARREEIEFINEIMGLGDNETALIALGNPKRLEEALEEFVRASEEWSG